MCNGADGIQTKQPTETQIVISLQQVAAVYPTKTAAFTALFV